MKWNEVRYKVERLRKEFAFEHSGHTISLREVFDNKGENIFCKALLLRNNKEVAKRYYGIDNRQRVINELQKIAEGYKIVAIDAITGNSKFSK